MRATINKIIDLKKNKTQRQFKGGLVHRHVRKAAGQRCPWQRIRVHEHVVVKASGQTVGFGAAYITEM